MQVNDLKKLVANTMICVMLMVASLPTAKANQEKATAKISNDGSVTAQPTCDSLLENCEIMPLDESKPSCDDVLKACDKHVDALEMEKEQMWKLIEQQNKNIAELEARAKPTPWWLYVLGGIGAGILVHQVTQ